RLDVLEVLQRLLADLDGDEDLALGQLPAAGQDDGAGLGDVLAVQSRPGLAVGRDVLERELRAAIGRVHGVDLRPGLEPLGVGADQDDDAVLDRLLLLLLLTGGARAAGQAGDEDEAKRKHRSHGSLPWGRQPSTDRRAAAAAEDRGVRFVVSGSN